MSIATIKFSIFWSQFNSVNLCYGNSSVKINFRNLLKNYFWKHICFISILILFNFFLLFLILTVKGKSLNTFFEDLLALLNFSY